MHPSNRIIPPAVRAWTLVLAFGAIAWCSTALGQRTSDVFRFGAFERSLGDLAFPTAAAIAPDGTIFVVDSGMHRIVAFSRNGERLRQFGSLGSDDGQLHSPSGIALDPDGTLHVVDRGNDRVVLMTPAGEFIGSWGTRGAAPGEFCEPRGICIEGDRIAIADTGNQRVQIFDLERTFMFAIGDAARSNMIHEREDASFKRPVDVAMDESGAIYVVDADRAMVSCFDADGSLVRAFGDYGPFVGLLNEPTGVVCSNQEIIIIDSANHRVQFFDGRGEPRIQWGIHDPASHQGDGRIHYPYDLALGGPAEDRFAVICEPLEHRCQVFRGKRPGEAPEPRQANVGSDVTHFGARISIDGPLVLIPEPEHHYIYVLDMRDELPVMVSQSGTRGVKYGQFLRPSGLLADYDQRTVTIVDSSLARLQTFSLAFDPSQPPKFDPFFARFVQAVDFAHPRFSRPTPELRWPLVPEAIRRDSRDHLHVLDTRNAMVAVFDPQWNFERAYGEFGGQFGKLRHPSDLAISPDGQHVYVVDAGNFRVQVFDENGSPVRSFGSYGEGDGQFLMPFGIAIDQQGSIYVSDMLADRIQKFDSAGVFIAQWGTRGADKDQLWRPMGMAIDQRQRLIVIDHGNHRAQMFSLEGEWLGSFGAGRAVLREQMQD